MAEAVGEYIWFIDADNDIEPESITLILQQIDNEPTDCLVFDYNFLWTEEKPARKDGENLPPRTRHLNQEEIFSEIVEPTLGYSREGVYNFFQGKPWTKQSFLSGGVVWNFVIKRKILIEKHLSFSSRLISNEDGMFVLGLYCYITEATALYAKLYNYYYRPNGCQRTIRDNVDALFANKMALVEERMRVCERYKQQYGRDFTESYDGSLFFSSMELCIKLSREKYRKHLRMFLEYVSLEPVRAAIGRIDASRAPLKYKLLVLLLCRGRYRTLFTLVYVAWRLGAQRLFKRFTAG